MSTPVSVIAEESQSLKIVEKKAAAAVRSAAKTTVRMPFIDNLRVFLTIMVVVFHLAITYGATGSWAYRERPTTEISEILLTLFVVLSQFFFMGLFFLVSGYFVPGSVDRKGGWRFLKDRLLRLGIPLVLYCAFISPFVEWVKGIQEGYFTGNLWQFFISYWRDGDFAPGPLWFLEILLVFSALFLIGRVTRQRLSARAAKVGDAPGQRALTHLHILGFILVLAPINFVVRLLSPIGEEWNHIQLAFLPQYALMFAAGILAYRRGWLPDLPAGIRKIWSIVAVLATFVLPPLMLLGGDLEQFTGGMTAQSLILSGWEAVYCISMSILMLSIFRSRLNFQGAAGRFLSQNAYTVYIIHAPLIVGLCWLLRGISIYPLLKFAVVAPIAVGLCFVISHLVRRIPLAEKVL